MYQEFGDTPCFEVDISLVLIQICKNYYLHAIVIMAEQFLNPIQSVCPSAPDGGIYLG